MTPSVCFLSSGLGYGGAEAQLTRIAMLFSARGSAVDVISMLPATGHADRLREAGVRVHSLAMVRGHVDPRAALSCISLLRRIRPDVLIGFNYPGTIMARVAGRAAGVRAILSSLRTERLGGPGRLALLKLTDRLSAATVVNASVLAQKLISSGSTRADSVRVIPNGIDMATLRRTPSNRAEIRAALGISRDEFLWTAAGRVDLPKDYPNLLAAMRMISEDLPMSLVIAGDGPLLAEMRQRVEAQGLGLRVRFLGFQTNLPSLMAASDGFVLASAWEGSPNVVLESLALGVPVVSTRVGGVAEALVDGEAGWIVPPGDPAGLAAAMHRLMATAPERRREMGARGRAGVERRFSLAHVFPMWAALVDDVHQARTVAAA